MKTVKIRVTDEQLKDFVRGRISYGEFAGDTEDFVSRKFVGDPEYRITLDDLTEGIRSYLNALRSGTRTAFDFINNWFYVLIYDLEDLIGLPQLVGMSDTQGDGLAYETIWSGNPFFNDEHELVIFIISRLDGMEDYIWQEEKIPGEMLTDLEDLLTVIDNYSWNAGRPKDEWKLTAWQKKQFVYRNSDDHDLDDADEDIVRLWKQYLEELCEQDDVRAIRILGYACYGNDNPVYPCDWEISRDCMVKLMEIGPDQLKAQAANTLGYIYYYGRTNGGEPQYDEAYRYFSLGAFFGYYESIYKVGDMLMAGKGTPQNRTAAFHLYQFVYNDCYDRFLDDGIGAQFADAALRMGGAYHHGNGTYQDLKMAYIYYMQARLAIRNRMADHTFFGDAKVSASISSGIAEIREELGDECRQKRAEIDLYSLIENVMLTDSRYVEVLIVRKKTITSLTVRRMEMSPWEPEPNVLITIPEISMCKLTREINVTAPASVPVELRVDDSEIKVNHVKIRNDKIHFYNGRRLVMTVGGYGWYIRAEKGSEQYDGVDN